jgi:hypothetical protein
VIPASERPQTLARNVHSPGCIAVYILRTYNSTCRSQATHPYPQPLGPRATASMPSTLPPMYSSVSIQIQIPARLRVRLGEGAHSIEDQPVLFILRGSELLSVEQRDGMFAEVAPALVAGRPCRNPVLRRPGLRCLGRGGRVAPAVPRRTSIATI